jgi:hypothetical protein
MAKPIAATGARTFLDILIVEFPFLDARDTETWGSSVPAEDPLCVLPDARALFCAHENFVVGDETPIPLRAPGPTRSSKGSACESVIIDRSLRVSGLGYFNIYHNYRLKSI